MGGTESIRSGARGTARADWVLVAALDCERPTAPPVRLSLSRVAEVAIGRGTERGFLRTRASLRIHVPDR